MRACWRCHTVSDTAIYRDRLCLCDACPVYPCCPPFHHQYIASDTSGILVCLQCGVTLPGGPISTAVVPAPAPLPDYVDC
jgi:hypothetical protein